MSDRKILRDCRLVNVHSGEIYPTDICIEGSRIVSVASKELFDDAEVIDCQGMFAAPGLIDAHMHVDTTFLWPGELARVLLPLGTTSVFVDNTNNAHTGGIAAVEAMQRAFDGLPLKAWFAAPSYCPFNPDLETAAAELGSPEIDLLLDRGCVSIGETVWSKIALGDRDYLRTIQTCRQRGMRVSGHGGEIRRGDEQAFDAYVAAGMQDDHCIGMAEDIMPRLRRAMKLFFVEASGRRGQLKVLLEGAAKHGIDFDQVCLCVDNITVMDMVEQGFGYLDYLVQIALSAGVPPIEVFRMASLNPAEHYRLSHEIGSIAPGRRADILLLRSLDAFPPEVVIANGEIVARKGKLTVDIPAPSFTNVYMRSIDIARVRKASLVALTDPAAASVRCRVIDVIDGDAFNKECAATLPVVEGQIMSDPANDVLKLIVAERYGRHGDVGVGFVKGFGLMRGAMATSMSIPSNNIVAVGVSDDEIWHAVQALGAMQGGFVLVENGEVVASVPLPVGGIMTTEPYEVFVEKIGFLQTKAREFGCELDHPVFTMAQTVLSTLPDLGLTDKGLVNARIGRIIPVEMLEAAA